MSTKLVKSPLETDAQGCLEMAAWRQEHGLQFCFSAGT
jgi:hypothetical protein